MRMESAAASKGTKSGAATRNLRPRDGTKLRALYDQFMANKGVPVEMTIAAMLGSPNKGGEVDQLRDFYGLDIRKLGYGRWVLAGEWFGKTYVDYIAERIAQAERRQ